MSEKNRAFRPREFPWQHLNVHHLHDLVAEDWQNIITRLTDLHARAYNWKPPVEEIRGRMAKFLKETVEREARLKIKGLVEHLDIGQQEVVMDYNQG